MWYVKGPGGGYYLMLFRSHVTKVDKIEKNEPHGGAKI